MSTGLGDEFFDAGDLITAAGIDALLQERIGALAAQVAVLETGVAVLRQQVALLLERVRELEHVAEEDAE